jgi:peptidoglycan/LPS O-acetylase OafA/YrhL
MLIIAWLLKPENGSAWLNRLLAVNLINRLGKYSYSFYLLHFVLLYLIAHYLQIYVSAETLSTTPLLFGLGLMVVTVPLTFWLAGAVYHRVEVPMIRVGKRLVRD